MDFQVKEEHSFYNLSREEIHNSFRTLYVQYVNLLCTMHQNEVKENLIKLQYMFHMPLNLSLVLGLLEEPVKVFTTGTNGFYSVSPAHGKERKLTALFEMVPRSF